MEEWQKQCINQNLPQLILETEFNAVVKAGLIANNILTRTEMEELDAERDRKGKTSANYKLYDCLLTRVGAYQVLSKILEENKQTGAVGIFKGGLRNLGIPKMLDGFNDTEIDVQGRIAKIHEFFPTDKLELAQQIFRDSTSEQELYEAFVTKQKTFVLATSNVPPEPTLYLPRFISNRIEVQESIFKSDCPDVFVFKNGITRVKLSEIAKPNWTASSNSQLRHITARFIYLDDYEDWNELKKLAKIPIHLISYDKDPEVYILEDSSAALDILTKMGSQKQRAYMSEEEFVQQQLSENLKISSVCICDVPGMGKTFLLKNISRLMAKHCKGTIVAFVQLSTFVTDFSTSSKNNILDQESSLLNVFSYVSTSFAHSKLLVKLVQAELIKVEILFDGFDEIPPAKIEWMKTVFLTIKGKLPNVRIYITSRPHMRHELETSLGVIAYDILPFNLQNQIDFLVRFWLPHVPDLDKVPLQNYASKCLKQVNQTLTRNDKEMAGIPLLCRLIAEVYAKKVQFCVKTNSPPMNFTLKIHQMYQQFIEQRIKVVSRNEDEFRNIKLIHIWHALKLLFPTDYFHDDEIFKTVNQEMASSAVFKVGIIQLQSNTKLEFLHRTFAEYFAAEYFTRKIHQSTIKPTTLFGKLFNQNKETKKCLALLLATQGLKDYSWIFYEYRFVHSVIVSFVDFGLNKVSISEEIKIPIASFCASITFEKFSSILGASFHHKFFNIFSLMKVALTKLNLKERKKYFDTEKCYRLLQVCIRESTSQMFHSCIQLFTEVIKHDMEQIVKHDKWNILLPIAAKAANYEAVEYLLDIVPLHLQQGVLKECVADSYIGDSDMLMRIENILHLLINKNPTFIQETPNILNTYKLDLRLFKVLVKLGANLAVVSRDNFASNCAMIAARDMSPTDYHELVQFFLTDYKAEYLFLPNEKWTDPLRYIINEASLLPETLELLLNIPGNHINMKDESGENLLFKAAQGNKVDNFQQLVDRGLDYNARGWKNRSLLHVAAGCGNVEMVRYFLSLKLDPNSCDENEWTPLHYAAISEYPELSVVEVLVENGANVHAKNNEGQTALHLSAARDFDLSIEVIKYLIGKGVGVNDRDNDGNTPLHLCTKKEAKDCLIEMGADIHAKNNDGKTALHLSAAYKYPRIEVIKYLIGKGAEVNDRDNDGNTPLHLCKRNDNMDYLIEIGADIHAKNNKGETPAQKNPHLWK